MQTQLHYRLNLRSTATRLCLLLSCGILLTSVGCGIPGRRAAQPGNAMPADYLWNNGSPFWRYNPAPQDQTNETSGEFEDVEVDEDMDRDVDVDVDAAPPRPKFVPKDLNSSLKDSASSHPVDRDSSVKPAAFSSPIQDDQSENDIEKRIRDIEDDINDRRPTPDDNDRRIKDIEDDINDGSPEKDSDQRIKDIEDDIKDRPGDETTPDDSKTQFDKLAEDYVDPSINIGIDGNSAQLPHNAFYNDPYLLSLIESTMAGNQELKILSEEIRIACNEAYARSGEYRPFVTLGGGVGFDKVGEHTRFGAVENQLEVSPDRAFPEPLGDFLVAADISWEVDIWHRLRNSQRVAALQYLGTQEGRNFIVTRMVSEVAENYYELLALDSRLEILQKTIEIQLDSLKVAEEKRKAGRETELAVQRFVAEVQKNRSEKSLIQQEIVEVENRINLLAGRYPQPVERISTDYIALNIGVLSAGVPSELLLNRADIREAERNVQAAGLNLEVARARFYPNLSIRSGVGWNAFRTGYLFRTPESLIYNLAADMVGPLINKRAIQADYRTANAEQLQTIYNYQQTVLEAHIEVVNHLTKVENFRRSIELKKKQLDALEKSVQVATQLFQTARADYVDVLLAQREMMEVRLLLIDTKKEQLGAVVNAYQALGGGQF